LAVAVWRSRFGGPLRRRDIGGCGLASRSVQRVPHKIQPITNTPQRAGSQIPKASPGMPSRCGVAILAVVVRRLRPSGPGLALRVGSRVFNRGNCVGG
jgi:hypothetical protein